MWTSIADFFASERYMPHGMCLLWEPGLLGLHVASDAVITLAYYTIPVALIYFAHRRRDLAYPWLFVLFGVFILGCGTTHLMGIWVLWHPDYAVDGIVKLVTALSSIATSAAVWWVMPQALQLPSTGLLEARVREQTAALTHANQELAAEMAGRERAQAALAESEQRFRDFADIGSDWLWETDAEGRFTYVSMGELDNARPEDFIGKTRDQLDILDRQSPVWRGYTADLAARRRVRNALIGWRGEDGRIRHSGINAKPVFAADGAFMGHRGVGRDMTPQVEAEQRAEALVQDNERRLAALVERRTDELQSRTKALQDEIAQRQAAEAAVRQAELEGQLRRVQRLDAIGQLTGGIAHDFNNLLTVIIGNLDRLADLESRTDERAGLAESALNAALRGSELTSRLLAFARQQPLSPQPIDLNARLPGMISVLARTLGEAVRIETALAPNLWITEADPSQVEDALVNLALNARDAMPRGGGLTITTRNASLDVEYAARNVDVAAGDYTVLEVTDTGSGMPPEVAERAFEPFFTTKERGTGLGLSMVYGFAKQSRGHLKIYSELGHGTTVSLYLPRSVADLTTAPESHAVTQAVPIGGESILVVEDDDDVRAITVHHLVSLGYRVQAAENGPAALAILDGSEAIDLLFTDVVMPGGTTGYDVADVALRGHPGIKLLFTTGYAGPPSSAGSARHANSPLLRKPFRKQDLAAAIRAALDPC